MFFKSKEEKTIDRARDKLCKIMNILSPETDACSNEYIMSALEKLLQEGNFQARFYTRDELKKIIECKDKEIKEMDQDITDLRNIRAKLKERLDDYRSLGYAPYEMNDILNDKVEAYVRVVRDLYDTVEFSRPVLERILALHGIQTHYRNHEKAYCEKKERNDL